MLQDVIRWVEDFAEMHTNGGIAGLENMKMT